MTEKRSQFIINKRSLLGAVCLVSLVFLLINSSKVVTFTFQSLNLCARSIIPSLFVYMIASDLLLTCGEFAFIENTLGELFERAFRISRACALAFVLGLVCGFPIGGKMVCDLYESKRISKLQAEKALGLCNNTGPAFVIAGIGASMLGSFEVGIVIYSSQILSAMITGVVFGFLGKRNIDYELSNLPVKTSPKKLCVIEIISNSVLRLLSICGCVVFFSVLSCLIVDLIHVRVLQIISSSVLEVGSAAKYLSSLTWVQKGLLLPVISAAVSFGGVSVYMQTKIFCDKADLSMKIYLIEKTCCAVFAFVICKIMCVILCL